MAKFQYPVTIDYVSDWRMLHGLREVLANGIDAEISVGAKLTVLYDSRKNVLRVRNSGTRLDVKALYFGGTNKTGHKQLIGQYGEGLKLALLVFARTGVRCVVRNDDELWTCAIEPDKNGIGVLTIDIKKAKVATGDVEVEVSGVEPPLYDELRDCFLRLSPSAAQIPTMHGEVLLDADKAGRYYARGVFIAQEPNCGYGYNLKELDVGRDRKSFSSYEAARIIQYMWGEAASKSRDYAALIYDGLAQAARDFEGAAWYSVPEISEALAEIFRARHGVNALPVSGTAEATDLEHFGMRGVVLPPTLVKVLQRVMPSPFDIRRNKNREVTRRYSLDELTAQERKHFQDAMEIMALIGVHAEARVCVVDFQDPLLEGLHKGEEVLVSRYCLGQYGRTLILLAHELGHDHGGDGSKGHVDAIQAILEKVLDVLYLKAKGVSSPRE